MSQVQFFKGKKSKLNNTFINNGSIYFIPEERRLYIDTANQRIPIISGIEFYLHCTPDSWVNNSDNQATASISRYFTSKSEGSLSYRLKEILSEENILFVGNVYDETENSNIQYVDIKVNANTKIEITPYSLQNGNKVYYNTEQGFAPDLWIYFYCPNPKIDNVATPLTVYTTTLIAYGIDLDNNTLEWSYNNLTNEYEYKLYVDEINILDYPYIIALSDDSLENYKEFYDKHIIIKDINFNGTSSVITLSTKKQVGENSYLPLFNISLDLIVFLGEEDIKEHNITLHGSSFGNLNINNTNDNDYVYYNIGQVQNDEYQIFIDGNNASIANDNISLSGAQALKILNFLNTCDIDLKSNSTNFSLKPRNSLKLENNTSAFSINTIEETDDPYDYELELSLADEDNYIDNNIGRLVARGEYFLEEEDMLVQRYCLSSSTVFSPIESFNEIINTNVYLWDYYVNDSIYYATYKISLQKYIDNNDKLEVVISKVNSTENQRVLDIEVFDDFTNFEPGHEFYYTLDITNQNIIIYYSLTETIKPVMPLEIKLIYKQEESISPTFIYFPYYNETGKGWYYDNNNNTIPLSKGLYDYIKNIKVNGKFDTTGNYYCINEFLINFDLKIEELINNYNHYALADCKMIAIQLDNLANIYDTSLESANWKLMTPELIEQFEQEHLNFIRHPNRKSQDYYWQALPTFNIMNPKEMFKLAGKHTPLIIANGEQAEFNYIIENKIADNGKIYFYTDKKPLEDIPIIIADFK